MTDTVTKPAAAPAGRGSRSAAAGLFVLAAIAGWLSYASVRTLAVSKVGPIEGSAFPLLLDAGVYVASQYYLSSARAARPQHGYKTLTRALIAATITINAAAASDWRGILVHVVPPAVFAALVELRARQVLGDARAEHGRPDRIPLRLWIVSPVESFRLSLWVARESSYGEQRAAREQYVTAVRALRIAVPGRGQARTARTLVRRQLRAGTLDPAALVAATGLDADPEGTGPAAVLRVALRAALGVPASAPESQDVSAPESAPRVRPTAAPGYRTRTAPAAGSSPIVLPQVRRTRTAASAPESASDRSVSALKADALDLDRTALAETGRPVSMRQLRRDLGIGQDRATELRDWLAAQREQLDTVTAVNGTD